MLSALCGWGSEWVRNCDHSKTSPIAT